MLADLSPMLTSLIRGLIQSPQIDVVEGTGRVDLESLVAESGATVVIMPGDPDGLPEAGHRLLRDRAQLRVLALRDHAASGVVGALGVHVIDVDSISKATLLHAVAGDLGIDDTSLASRKRGAA